MTRQANQTATENSKCNSISFVTISEFIYCGIVLQNDSRSLAEQGVRAGSTIHVFAKPEEEVAEEGEPIPEDQIQLAVINYRLIVKELTGTALAVSSARSFASCMDVC